MATSKDIFFEAVAKLRAQLTTHLGGDMASLGATTPATYTAVMALWVHPTAADLDTLKEEVNQIFIYAGPTSIQSLLSLYRRTHITLANNHSAMSPEDQIRALKNCLTGSPVASNFAHAISTFDISNSAPGGANRTFATLAAIAEIANDQIPFSMKATAYSAVTPTAAAAMLPPVPKKPKHPIK